jgi:type II secretory pathway predicted ATPase ExeA
MEHLEHFGLTRDPFRNDPQRRFYFKSHQHQDAERRLLRGVRQGKGLAVLLGQVGSGKTTLVRHLLEQLDESRFEASLLVLIQGAVDTDWLLVRFARHLGIEEPAAKRAALLGQIYARLVTIHQQGQRAVILIDEAQMLNRREILVELRGLLNLEFDEERLLSLVLTGLPELEDVLKLDAPLADRVEIRVALSHLDAESSHEYLAHRIRMAGGNPAILAREAAAGVARFAGGIPRRMNTLADNALFEAYLAGRRSVSIPDVELAAADLGWSPSDALAPYDVASSGEPSPSRTRDAAEGACEAVPSWGLEPDLLPTPEPESSGVLQTEPWNASESDLPIPAEPERLGAEQPGTSQPELSSPVQPEFALAAQPEPSFPAQSDASGHAQPESSLEGESAEAPAVRLAEPESVLGVPDEELDSTEPEITLTEPASELEVAALAEASTAEPLTVDVEEDPERVELGLAPEEAVAHPLEESEEPPASPSLSDVVGAVLKEPSVPRPDLDAVEPAAEAEIEVCVEAPEEGLYSGPPEEAAAPESQPDEKPPAPEAGDSDPDDDLDRLFVELVREG